jgi:DNA-binding IclR family transcriptional regulator
VRLDSPGHIDDFSAAILHLLSSETSAAGMSVPRLSKALGRSASVVMRQLTLMGDVCGLGWVTVTPEGERFMVRLSELGRTAWQHAQKSA